MGLRGGPGSVWAERCIFKELKTIIVVSGGDRDVIDK